MLALLVFLGGFSAATSMVVMCAIAVATMVSNHWLVPAWLALRRIPPRTRPTICAASC
ncbi:hypothetical protein FLP41_09600 [Paracoccus marcusii]|nr:hypothetical protein FLP41_09600 [Paracoccus marcusii]